MKNIECIFKLNLNLKRSICSGSFINDKNNIYLVVDISDFMRNFGEISIYDFHFNEIKKINDFNEPCNMAHVFYDKKKLKNYISVNPSI